MSITVQVRQRGAVTLPAGLRKRYSIQAGDALQIVDLDGVFVFSLMAPVVLELAREIERARIEADLSSEELLAGLREERQLYSGSDEEGANPVAL